MAENAVVAQLDEGAKIIGDVQIAVEIEPLQQIAVGGRRLDAEIGILIRLEAFADFAAKSEKDRTVSARAEGDVFESFPQSRIGLAGEIGKIIIVAQIMERRIDLGRTFRETRARGQQATHCPQPGQKFSGGSNSHSKISPTVALFGAAHFLSPRF